MNQEQRDTSMTMIDMALDMEDREEQRKLLRSTVGMYYNIGSQETNATMITIFSQAYGIPEDSIRQRIVEVHNTDKTPQRAIKRH